MTIERVHYTERTPWPGFALAILWGAISLACYPILAGWDHDLPPVARWSIVGGVVAFAALIQAVLGGLTVRVEASRLVVHLGAVPLVRRFVPYDEILGVESVVYRPIAEFGGWGVRGFGKRKAWTARGDRAVKLTLSSGRELLIGSDNPQRLEERIRSVSGIVRA
jgi:hypothetical protein